MNGDEQFKSPHTHNSGEESNKSRLMITIQFPFRGRDKRDVIVWMENSKYPAARASTSGKVTEEYGNVRGLSIYMLCEERHM